MSDAGSIFISGTFKTFCNRLNMEQAFSLSYHHQSNGQAEACIKFVKCTLKKCPITDMYIPTGARTPSPAHMLFNSPIRGILAVINRPPVGIDNDQEHYEVIAKRKTKDDKGRDTPKMYVSIPIGSTVVVQQEDGGP